MTLRARFYEWVSAHGGIVAKVARSFSRTPAEAADLRQEILMQLWIALPRFAEESRVSTFVYRICLNTALAWKRGAGRRERRTGDADLTQLAADTASPADGAEERQLLEKLHRAIHQVPEAQRALLLLSPDGLSYREMADVTGLTENHVGVALSRARKRLALLLKGVVDELE